MSQSIRTIVFPVKDLARANAIFGKLLGVEPYCDQPYHVGYKSGDNEIGLDPNGHKAGLSGPVAYCDVGNIREALENLVAAGAKIQQEVKDVGGGKLVAIMKDVDGNL